MLFLGVAILNQNEKRSPQIHQSGPSYWKHFVIHRYKLWNPRCLPRRCTMRKTMPCSYCSDKPFFACKQWLKRAYASSSNTSTKGIRCNPEAWLALNEKPVPNQERKYWTNRKGKRQKKGGGKRVIWSKSHVQQLPFKSSIKLFYLYISD